MLYMLLDQEYDEINMMIAQFQNTQLIAGSVFHLSSSCLPPHNMALGGGLRAVPLHSDQTFQAHAELYYWDWSKLGLELITSGWEVRKN